MCPRPITVAYRGQVPCGQCMACRVNRRRAWTTRIMLEADHLEQLGKPTSFATLTYDNDHVPLDEDGTAILVKRDLQLFFKRYRKDRNRALGPIRYFAVGEYGTQTQRPHYHAVLFGVYPWELDIMQRTWGKGFVDLKPMVAEHAAYVGHYCLKKWTQEGHEKLQGRPPEFTLMSRRPAVGTAALEAIADAHMTEAGSRHLAETGDVFREVVMHGKHLPLDRTMLTKLREQLGVPVLARDRPEYVKPDIQRPDDRTLNNREELVARRMKNHGTL